MSQVEGSVLDNCVDVEIHIEAPPHAVYDFLVDAEKVLRWMGEKIDIDPRPGGRFWLNLGDDTAEGEYVELIPDQRVVFTWGWVGSDTVPPGSSTVTFELQASDTGTTVRLLHTGLPADECEKHLEGWLHFASRMSAAVAGESPDQG